MEYLEEAAERFSLAIHSFCLMDNHYHLLVETHQPNLGKAMQWLNGSYAIYMNRKHQRIGHLFQGRYRAILIDADAYLKQLSRYIHLNPVRAGIVPAPADYRWSSYGAFVGTARPHQFLETGWLLSAFSLRKSTAHKAYRDFVENIAPGSIQNPHENLVGGFLLGEKTFVNWVKETFIYRKSDDSETPQLKRLKTEISITAVLQAVACHFNTSERALLTKGRKNNDFREVAIYLAKSMTGLSCKKLGEHFGRVSGACITMTHKRLADKIKADRRLNADVQKLKKRILNI
jgi:REP element-mobilizing transposase RayT